MDAQGVIRRHSAFIEEDVLRQVAQRLPRAPLTPGGRDIRSALFVGVYRFFYYVQEETALAGASLSVTFRSITSSSVDVGDSDPFVTKELRPEIA